MRTQPLTTLGLTKTDLTKLELPSLPARPQDGLTLEGTQLLLVLHRGKRRYDPTEEADEEQEMELNFCPEKEEVEID